MHMTATVADAAKVTYTVGMYLNVHLPVLTIRSHCPAVVLRGMPFSCQFTAFGTGMAATVHIDDIGSFNMTIAGKEIQFSSIQFFLNEKLS